MEEQKQTPITEETIQQAEAPVEIGLNQQASPEEDVIRLREENMKFRDQALRAMAEAENIRKRTEREIEDNTKYAVTGISRDLIGVLENLYRAEANITEGEQREGVTLIRKELEKIFEKNGIRRIEPAGEKFNHNFHQAVTQVENKEVEAGTILQVLQAGYVIRDRLLRPAIVVVSK
jgi:molecular chaperone GrpE